MTGSELKEQRTKLCLTQKELASKLGVNRLTIVNYEKEKTPIPKSKLNLLYSSLNVNLEDRTFLTPVEEAAMLVIKHVGHPKKEIKELRDDINQLKGVIELLLQNLKIDDAIAELRKRP